MPQGEIAFGLWYLLRTEARQRRDQAIADARAAFWKTIEELGPKPKVERHGKNCTCETYTNFWNFMKAKR